MTTCLRAIGDERMDPRPIGIFDSGAGGLTALRALRRIMPGENCIYFGDTARVPYGGRPVSELRALAASDSGLLRARGVKAILVACGTISSNCLEYAEGGGVPAVGVLLSSAREAAQLTKNGRIGVLATVATARSGSFERAIGSFLPGAEVVCSGSPLLVPLVEAGRVSPEDEGVAAAVSEALAPLLDAGIDTLVLGCTHFPLLADTIARFAPGVETVDSGAAGARAMAALIAEKGLAADRAEGGCEFLASADPDAFARNARRFLGGEIRVAQVRAL